MTAWDDDSGTPCPKCGEAFDVHRYMSPACDGDAPSSPAQAPRMEDWGDIDDSPPAPAEPPREGGPREGCRHAEIVRMAEGTFLCKRADCDQAFIPAPAEPPQESGPVDPEPTHECPVCAMLLCHHAIQAPAPSLVEVENVTLRRMLWLSHGHDFAALYGDDGEMQCNARECRIDFKRMAADAIQERLLERGRKRLERASGSQPAKEEDPWGVGGPRCLPGCIDGKHHPDCATLAPPFPEPPVSAPLPADGKGEPSVAAAPWSMGTCDEKNTPHGKTAFCTNWRASVAAAPAEEPYCDEHGGYCGRPTSAARPSPLPPRSTPSVEARGCSVALATLAAEVDERCNHHGTICNSCLRAALHSAAEEAEEVATDLSLKLGKAEARLHALEAALRKIAAIDPSGYDSYYEAERIAREALR